MLTLPCPQLQQRFKMDLLQCVSEHQRCLPAWSKQDVNKNQKSGGPTLPTYILGKQNLSLHEISA